MKHNPKRFSKYINSAFRNGISVYDGWIMFSIAAADVKGKEIQLGWEMYSKVQL